MIPFPFDYYRPDSISEAVRAFRDLDAQGKEPLYYSGGSEIISMARSNHIFTKAVIDLKAIPESLELKYHAGKLVIGSSVTLSSLTESNVYPLMSKACGRIADHTMQCKITVGGNVCGTIIYKEALLPLLLSDCSVVIAGEDSLRHVPIHLIFNKEWKLSRGEFIVQFIIDGKYLELPYFHIKKTKNEKIDYPLLSLAAFIDSGNIKAAFSGLCEFPFRSMEIESELNKKNIPVEERIKNVFNLLPAPVLNDISGSDQYRLFVLKNTLLNVMNELEG
jgi:CO/xanthine dehydrogenase FAD-binding subunit